MNTIRTCQSDVDCETTFVFDAAGSLGSIETPYTACAWRRVHDANGKLIAHVRRRWDLGFVVEILIAARQAVRS